MPIIESNVEKKLGKISKNKLDKKKRIEIVDGEIERGFNLYRQWFQFYIPKAFRVINNLQRYVCEKNCISPGSYSYFINLLENDFVPDNLSILLEYGLSNTMVLKMKPHIHDDLSEEKIIEYVKENINFFESILS